MSRCPTIEKFWKSYFSDFQVQSLNFGVFDYTLNRTSIIEAADLHSITEPFNSRLSLLICSVRAQFEYYFNPIYIEF